MEAQGARALEEDDVDVGDALLLEVRQGGSTGIRARGAAAAEEHEDSGVADHGIAAGLHAAQPQR